VILWMDPVARTGASNMAWDQTLLDLAEAEGRFVVRLYRWEPHCLSFGRNEPALRRYDRAMIEAARLDVVRRPTGGRAVWHARELTYAVAAPSVRLGSLAQAYRTIHEVLAGAVRTLGAAPALAAAPVRSAPVDAGACFASPAGGEVLVDGAKVVGSAQVRQGSALLQHGSMLLEDDQSVVASITLGDAPASGGVPLARLLRRPVAFDEAAAAVAAAARDAWPGEWNETSAAAPVEFTGSAALAARLAHHEHRFRDAGWTWQR
jgi:lipoyl(octanoyl) transferase